MGCPRVALHVSPAAVHDRAASDGYGPGGDRRRTRQVRGLLRTVYGGGKLCHLFSGWKALAVAKFIARNEGAGTVNCYKAVVLRTISVLDLDRGAAAATIEALAIAWHLPPWRCCWGRCLAFGPDGQSLLVQDVPGEGVRSYDLLSGTTGGFAAEANCP